MNCPERERPGEEKEATAEVKTVLPVPKKYKVHMTFIENYGRRQTRVLGYFDTHQEALQVFQAANKKIQESRNFNVILNHENQSELVLQNDLLNITGKKKMPKKTDVQKYDETSEECDLSSRLEGAGDATPETDDLDDPKTRELDLPAANNMDVQMDIVPMDVKTDIEKLRYELEKQTHESETLKMRLHRRTKVLDSFREKYLQDVVLLKEQMYGQHENIEKYKSKPRELSYIQGLPKDVMRRMIPGFDLRQSLPMFGPGNDLFMHVKPCVACGGYLEVMVYPEEKIKYLIKEYKKLYNKCMNMSTENEQHTLAAKYMLKELNEKGKQVIAQAQEIELLHTSLKKVGDGSAAELEKLMKIKHKKLLDTLDRMTTERFESERRSRLLLEREQAKVKMLEQDREQLQRNLDEICSERSKLQTTVARLEGKVTKQKEDFQNVDRQKEHYHALYLEMKDKYEANEIKVQSLLYDIEQARIKREEKEQARKREMAKMRQQMKHAMLNAERTLHERDVLAKDFSALRIKTIFGQDGKQKIRRAFQKLQSHSMDIAIEKLHTLSRVLREQNMEYIETGRMMMEEARVRAIAFACSHESLQTKYDQVRTAHAILQDRFDKQTGEILALRSHVKALADEACLLKHKLRAKAGEHMETQTYVKSLQQRMHELHIENAASRLVQPLVSECIIRQGKLIDAKLRLQFDHDKTVLDKTVQSTKDELACATDHVSTLTMELKELSNKATSLALTIKQKEEELFERDKRLHVFEKELEELLASQQKAVHDLTISRNETKVETEAKVGLEGKLEVLLVNSTKTIDNLKQQIARMESSIIEGQKRVSHYANLATAAEESARKATSRVAHMQQQVQEVKERKRSVENLLAEEQTASRQVKQNMLCLSQMYTDLLRSLEPSRDITGDICAPTDELTPVKQPKFLQQFAEGKEIAHKDYRQRVANQKILQEEIDRLNNLVAQLRTRIQVILAKPQLKRRGPPPNEAIPNFLRCRWEDPEGYISTRKERTNHKPRHTESAAECNLGWTFPPPLGDIIEPRASLDLPSIQRPISAIDRTAHSRTHTRHAHIPSVKLHGFSPQSTGSLENGPARADNYCQNLSQKGRNITERMDATAGRDVHAWRRMLNHGVQ